VACAPTHPRRHLLEVLANSALRLLTALPRFLLAALLGALAALLAALILLAWLLFIRVHNCSFVPPYQQPNHDH
jgi:hypothetical protein